MKFISISILNRVFFMLVIFTIYGHTSSRKDIVTQKINYQGHNINVTYKYKYTINDKFTIFSLSNLFDSDVNTSWSFYGKSYFNKVHGCTGEIYFQFEEAVKIDSITLTMNTNSQNFPKDVSVNIFYGDDLRLMDSYGEWLKYHIKKGSKINIDIKNKIYYPDFYVKTFSIAFLDCYKNQGSSMIEEIEISFLKNEAFVPTLSYDELDSLINDQKYIEKNGKGLHGQLWKVRSLISNKDELIDKIRRHLIYYGLHGNQEAENLLLTDTSTYEKIDGVHGLDDMYLEDWYFTSKQKLTIHGGGYFSPQSPY